MSDDEFCGTKKSPWTVFEKARNATPEEFQRMVEQAQAEAEAEEAANEKRAQIQRGPTARR